MESAPLLPPSLTVRKLATRALRCIAGLASKIISFCLWVIFIERKKELFRLKFGLSLEDDLCWNLFECMEMASQLLVVPSADCCREKS